MQLKDFVKGFRNHPIIFIGTGFSLRYSKISYTWEDLLKKIAFDLTSNEEYFLDLKADFMNKVDECDYSKVAGYIEKDFTKALCADREGKFKAINDLYYEKLKEGKKISRFKLYLSKIFGNIEYKDSMEFEIKELIKAKKNIASIITTNYDNLIERITGFMPLIGNDILLSNPYGSVYKIHGCATSPDKIIITDDDYKEFEKKYELIRAQLISLFIHNPIIFIGYSITDKNIRDILKTIFSYVEPNSDQAKQIRDNFLLVEYDRDNTNTDVLEHDIDIENFPIIRINKLKTDNYIALYESISNLSLPISVMDIRKVQNIMHEIFAGGGIKVEITENLDVLQNSDKVLVIGSANTIRYDFKTVTEMICNYFEIIDEVNDKILSTLDKQQIQKNQYFPMFGFSSICDKIKKSDILKIQQKDKLKQMLKKVPEVCKTQHTNIEDIMSDANISNTNKILAIIYALINDSISVDSVKIYLQKTVDKSTTDYRKLLCAYDLKKYGTPIDINDVKNTSE